MNKTICLGPRQDQPIEELEHRCPTRESIPDEALKAQLRVDQIRAVLDTVGVRTRAIYFAHRAGYSYAEIAEHSNISHSAIKRHIARALLAIMERMAS